MNKLTSTIAAAAIVCISTLSAGAQEMTTHLTVNLHDGTTEHYKLLDSPTVRMENHQIIVSSESLEGTYDFEKVSHFSFIQKEDEEAGIANIITDDTSFAFSFVDNATIMISAPTLEWATVYTTGGMQVTHATADANHTVTLDISELTPGMYIVTPSCHSAIKIVKR